MNQLNSANEDGADKPKLSQKGSLVQRSSENKSNLQNKIQQIAMNKFEFDIPSSEEPQSDFDQQKIYQTYKPIYQKFIRKFNHKLNYGQN